MRRTILFGVFTVFVLCYPTVEALGVTIDFNAAGDFTSNFVINPAGARYSEQNAVGIGGSRGVEIGFFGANDNGKATAVYNASTFSLAPVGAQVQTSLTVLTGTYNTAQPTLQLGFVGGVSQNLTTTDTSARYLVVEYNRFFSHLSVWNKNASTAPSQTNFPAGSTQTGNWYELSVVLTNQGTANIGLSATLLDRGTNGLAAPTQVLSIPLTTFANADLASDTSVFPAFLGHSAGGGDAYDNFAAVPEPAFASPFAVGAVVVLFRRRHHPALRSSR